VIGAPVLDFDAGGSQAGTAFSVATGSTTPDVSLDFEGDEGSLLQVSGHIVLDVFGFVSLDGEFAFKKANGNFLLNDGTALTAVPYLSVGGNITTATVSAGSVSLVLTGVEFGMVLVSNGATSYSAIKAKVTNASLNGIAGLGITVTDFYLSVNKTSSVTVGAPVLDFDAGGSQAGTAFSVATGSTTPDVTLDFDGDEGSLLQVSGHIVLDVFGFVSLDGEFAFKKANGNFLLNDGTALTAVPYLSVGGNITTATVSRRAASHSS
jgi:hypothetical protein